MGPDFEVRVELTDGRAVLVVNGELDVLTAPTLRDEIDRASAGGTAITVDLAGVTFVDSAGIAALIDAYTALEQDPTRLTLRGPSDAVLRVLEITALLDYFAIEDPTV